MSEEQRAEHKASLAGMVAGLGSGLILFGAVWEPIMLVFGIPIAIIGFVWGYRLKALWPGQQKNLVLERKQD